MSVLAFNRREVRAERIYFIPVGTVVDAVTVANAVWPDASPLTNWTDFEFKDIETLKPEKETDSETFMIPDSSNGYQEDLDEWVKSRSWIAETAKTNAIVIMLEEGLASLPVAGVAQIPDARKENYVEGVMQKETTARGTGIIKRRQCWVRVYLVSPGDSGPKTNKVQLRFRRMDSANNTFVMVA